LLPVFGLFGRMGLVIYLLHVIGLYLLTGWMLAPHGWQSPIRYFRVNRQGMIPILLNLWMAGEWLHNHHHHRQESANFGLWGEIDTGYLIAFPHVVRPCLCRSPG
jgi:fatty-acid desaturase